MFLHESYCLRNIKLCQVCDTGIELADYEEHIKRKHYEPAKIIKEESKSQSESIKKPVTTRNVRCKTCNTEQAEDTIETHILQCVSQFEQCQYCYNNFLAKEMSNHLENCESKLFIQQMEIDNLADVEEPGN